VRGVVAQQFKRVGVFLRDDRNRRVAVEQHVQIAHLAVDAQRQRGLGEAGTDVGGKLGARDGLIESANAAVGKSNSDHGALN
jgi:hypothetical protein